jgi:hypothetical protein
MCHPGMAASVGPFDLMEWETGSAVCQEGIHLGDGLGRVPEVHRVHADLVGGDHIGLEVVQNDHLVGADAEPLAGAVRRQPRQRGPDPRPAPPADLTKTLGLTQAQLDTAHGDLATQLPDGLQRPTRWRAEEDSPPTY